MSSRDARRTALGLLAAVVLIGVGGCTSAAADSAASATSSAAAVTTAAPTGVPADDVTARIAAVEFARQCTVTQQSFVDETGYTTDLDSRLATAGLTHAQWKSWHDALPGSPDLVTQLATVSAPGCPAA